MSDQNNNQLANSKNQLTQSKTPLIGAWVRTNEEKRLYLAPHGKRLVHFKNNDMNELKAVVIKWVYYLGLTDKVVDKDIIALTKVIQELFPQLTIEDIRLAIDLCLKNELGIDIECYGNFSPMYVSKILNAYLIYSNTKIREINWRKNTIEQQQVVEVEEPYEKRVEARRRIIRNYFDKLLSTQNYVADFDSIIWGLFVRKKLIDPTKIDLVEAEQWAEQKVIQESRTIEAKKFQKLGEEQRQKEIDIFKKLYGRYFVMKKVLSTMNKPMLWLESLSDEDILPKSKKK
jgi:hypothetical protein